jgi:CubicO group peptidase (beta-lactamase class C family)
MKPVSPQALRLSLPFAVFCSVFLVACGNAPQRPQALMQGDYSATREYVTALIRHEMARNDVVGASIALVDDQRVVWSEGFGHADLEAGERVSITTPFRLGSIAKVMTAGLAMQMAERGELSLDAPLAEQLPGFSVRSRFAESGPITPRNIMNHHSGLPSNRLGGMMGARPMPIASLVPAMRDEYVAYPADYVFSYSNLGVTLLGAAMETRQQRPFDMLLRDRLFAPLGMRHARISSMPLYKEYRRGQAVDSLALRDLPSGGLVASADDMSRFMRMLFGGGQLDGARVLNEDSLAEMWRVQNGGNALDFGLKVGLGWMLSGFDIPGAGLVASHGGTLLDSHSLMIVLPEHKLGVVVMANSAESMGMVKQVASETLRLALETKSGVRPALDRPRFAIAPARAIDLSEQQTMFDTLVGLARVAGDSESLDAKIMGHTLELKPDVDGQFSLRYKLFGLFPVSLAALDDVRVSLARVEQLDLLVGHFEGHSRLLGQRLQAERIPQSFLEQLGEYEVVGEAEGLLPSRLSLLHEDGLLVGEASFKQFPDLQLRIAMQPLSEDELLIAGMGTGKRETIRVVERQGERRLLFSGLELRRKDAPVPARQSTRLGRLDRLEFGENRQHSSLDMPTRLPEAGRLQRGDDLGG